jgi:hypothetical protein
MGLENHRCRYGRLINVLVRFFINVLVWKFYKERIVFAAARYNPTYKNKPDDAVCIVGFLFCGK